MARRALTAVERENVRALDEFTAGLTVFTMALGAVQTFFMMWIQQEHLKLLQQGMTWRVSTWAGVHIVEFIEFTNKHFSKICDSLKFNKDQLKLAISEIEKLNPKPGGGVDTAKYIQRIIPDFTIQIEDEKVAFTLNARNAPSLRINKDFSDLLLLNKEKKGNISKSQKEALLFTKQKLDSARWFINAIYQRQQTLILTMSTILDIQKEYFLFGDESDLKPMILKDVAEKTNLDISTISRVVNSKYVDTPYGTFSLRHFFSESIAKSDGENISVKEVKNIITDLIKSEDSQKPLNDQKLVDELNKKGYKIARRTVAKYREQMNFPVARLRKKISWYARKKYKNS